MNEEYERTSIVTEILNDTINDCGKYNLVLASGAGISGGFLVFTLVLYLLSKNN